MRGIVYRKFKPPFSERRYIAEPASMSIVGAISEICGFASVASAAQRSGTCEACQIAPLAPTQSEPLRRLAWATGFGLSDCLE
jgi:hypothetical protein